MHGSRLSFIPMFRMIFFMGKRGPKPAADRLLLITTAYPIYDDFWGLAKGGRRGVVVEKSGKVTTVRDAHLPAEPDTLIALLEAQTVKQVRAICRKSAWMAKQPNSYLARFLSGLAQQFLDAKEDRHYPCSERSSSIQRKFWFLARALAGAMYGLSPRRSINLIGPGKPEKIFENIYSAKTGQEKRRKP